MARLRKKLRTAGVVAAAASVCTAVFVAFQTVAPRGTSPQWWALWVVLGVVLAVEGGLLLQHLLLKPKRWKGLHRGR